MKKIKSVVSFMCAIVMFISIVYSPQSVQVVKAADATGNYFSWDNATVYFVMTDRFLDADSSNNHSYGRELDGNGNEYSGYQDKTATFHGGDLKGLTQKLNEGYFTDLGINAIWITAPYEQVHGWVGGENFRHYAYHGYYTLDWTEVDGNMGTEEDLQEFIDTAHAKDIRIIFDIVMNHTGYETMKDMDEFGFGTLYDGWYNYYYNSAESSAHYDTYDDYIGTSDSNAWAKWWGSDWVRKDGISGYDSGGSDDYTMSLAGLPDVKTEATTEVGIPQILQTKWDDAKETQEREELDAFFGRTGYSRTPDNYIIKWLTDWVREYGVDGFRVDTAKHVNIEDWQRLKDEAVIALDDWKKANPDKALDDLDFWMTGEIWGHGVGKSTYFNYGFDSVINFDYQGSAGNISSVESIYSSYASSINTDPNFNVLSYISSHDTSLYRGDMIDTGSAFLMLPGGVQIFYGDESNRPADNSLPWDQPTRTDMNWGSIDNDVLSHWQKLGQFRNNHIAIGAGDHNQISSSPYTFSRTYNENGIEDSVVVVFEASGSVTIDVSSVFSEGTDVIDSYTGNTATVSGGKATFTADSNGVILIEEDNSIPTAKVSAFPSGGKFYTDTETITLNVYNVGNGYYTLDGSDPATNGTTYVHGETITIGSDMVIGDTVKLKLYATNEYGTDTVEYTFEKVEREQLTVHYKLPDGWGEPQLYYYDTDPVIVEPTWSTSPNMVSEGDGWYYYTIEDEDNYYIDSAYIIFKDKNGNQIPGVGETGYLVSGENWFDGTDWYEEDPETPDTQSPTAPTGLESNSQSSSTITLTWIAATDDIGVEGYEIYRDGIKVGTSTTTTYTDTGLTASTSYEYTVKAYDAALNLSVASIALIVSTTEATSNEVTIYYKQGYTTPYIHYVQADGSWTEAPGIAIPESEINGYNVITIDIGEYTELEACFNDGNGNWDSNNANNYFFGVGTWTYDGGTITEGAPTKEENPTDTISVTFTINNAYTYMGQNIYIVGNCVELGNWDTSSAVGPASCPDYPTWTITIDLPAGETIEFKAIMIDSSSNVTWQSGSNQIYTVPTSGSGSVEFSW